MSSNSRVCFGLRYTHVLQRLTSDRSSNGTLHLMKYIFPRQFGLHNAFTSDVDPKNTSQPFKDYTMREQEIKRALVHDPRSARKVPKRLRGQGTLLLERLRQRHARCPYTALLQHYCSIASCHPGASTQAKDENIIGLATPAGQVSAYCRSVVTKVFPSQLWGNGQEGCRNKETILKNIDKFIKLRRYETMTLHDVLQNLMLTDIQWLAIPGHGQHSNLSASDFAKRNEIFAELVYYLFDSFLIPLISSNFHVTESSTRRNELCYFRHDVWKKLSEPALTNLKSSMFEELDSSKMKRLLSRRGLGASRVRLLPKETGMRPIINLRRRVLSTVNGKKILSRSINSILAPGFNVLNYEKVRWTERHVQDDADSFQCKDPGRLGSSLFSADDIFPRLQNFRKGLHNSGHNGRPLYFAKLDVLSCFDTIPQGPLIDLLGRLFTAEGYTTSRYAEARILEGHSMSLANPKTTWRFAGAARAMGERLKPSRTIEEEAASKRDAVFVDAVVENRQTAEALLSLLSEHIQRNVVQIGKKYYRQKTGIPQGSLVSSLLCSFFYAELEREMLAFLDRSQSLLLRLIDDFLLITTDGNLATRFVQVMHAGIPEYGLSIKREKSLVNFDVQVDGVPITKLPAVSDFPYCGNAINTVDLHITKDESRRLRNSKTIPQSLCIMQSTDSSCRSRICCDG